MAFPGTNGDTQDNHYRYSGLGAGEHIVEVYFWDSYPTHYETVRLAEGESKSISVKARTDQVARIGLAGKVLNKKTGQGIKGAKVHFSVYDLEVLDWALGSLLGVEYDNEQDVLIIRNIKPKNKDYDFQDHV